MTPREDPDAAPSAQATVHIVSDSTGETASAAAAAVLSQFPAARTRRRTHVFARSPEVVDRALQEIARDPGLVVYTLLDPALARRVEQGCADLGLRAVALLDPFFDAVAETLDVPRKVRPGRQHAVGEGYFARVAAIDFAMTQDDGASLDRLRKADVVLVGVSRTSKTPTCLYLAVRGVRAANVPLVPGVGAPPALVQAVEDGAFAVGLTASPSRLRQVRSERLETLGADRRNSLGADRREAAYAEASAVAEEVAQARLIFDRLEMPVIDVTRRSIEETAASVMALLRDRESAARPSAPSLRTP
ncbi:MAG: pyruvate, water dikinase regulatory protein [Pseudomonadota bacterium]